MENTTSYPLWHLFLPSGLGGPEVNSCGSPGNRAGDPPATSWIEPKGLISGPLPLCKPRLFCKHRVTQSGGHIQIDPFPQKSCCYLAYSFLNPIFRHLHFKQTYILIWARGRSQNAGREVLVLPLMNQVTWSSYITSQNLSFHICKWEQSFLQCAF